MISKKTIAAGLVALTTLTAVPANAGGFTVEFGFGGPAYGWSGPGYGWRDHRGPRWRHNRLSPHEVRRILSYQGYRHIDFVDRRGPVYEVRARRHGRLFYLVVSARNGDILARHRI